VSRVKRSRSVCGGVGRTSRASVGQSLLASSRKDPPMPEDAPALPLDAAAFADVLTDYCLDVQPGE
jgi:hypothetical protein